MKGDKAPKHCTPLQPSSVNQDFLWLIIALVGSVTLYIKHLKKYIVYVLEYNDDLLVTIN